MRRIIEKFDSHKIADFAASRIAKLSDYGYVKHLQQDLKVNTLEIVVILDNHSKEIPDIFTLVNHRISVNKDIPTFFRGQNGRSFLFPAGVNLHFVTPSEFASQRSRWNIVGGACEAHLVPLLSDNLKSDDVEILILEDTVYRSMDREISSYWNKN